MQRKAIQALGILLLLAVSTAIQAGACTYREAIMAMERGNMVRGMALMRMASRDGDGRAVRYLARRAADGEILAGSAPLSSISSTTTSIVLVQK
jgi:hypothetical protein